MKYLKKILLAATLAVASLGFTSFSANAVIITQEFDFLGGPFGSVTIEIPDTELGNGLVFVDSFVELNLLGETDFTNNGFFVTVNGDNVFDGIEFISFDVMANNPDFWNWQLVMDAFTPAVNFLDVFDDFGNPVLFAVADELSLGKATFVSEPSVLALFAVALVAMGARRRKV